MKKKKHSYPSIVLADHNHHTPKNFWDDLQLDKNHNITHNLDIVIVLFNIEINHLQIIETDIFQTADKEINQRNAIGIIHIIEKEISQITDHIKKL